MVRAVGKILFIPFGALSGLLAGLLGRKAFETLWRVLDGAPAPDPKRPESTWRRLLPALALEGAIFRAARGMFDYGSRRVFTWLTGRWPGEKRPDAA